jgi:two-component system LytT family response regulator
VTLRTLIVDDEPLARRRLRQLLQSAADVAVVGESEDGPSAVASVRRLEPDLILLDVQMPGMDGFDVIAELGPAECPAVVFVTAFDRYAVRAFEVHAIDYLLKPFDRARLDLALARARQLVAGDRTLTRRLAALVTDLQAKRPLSRLVVKDGDRVYFVRVDDVAWFEAVGHYVCLHAGGQSPVIRDTLAHLESRLDPERFVRVHRSAILNIDHMKELRPAFRGEFVIELRDGTRLTSSRGCADRLRQLLKHR